MNEPIQEGKPIYVFQLPIRIWHWSMVLSFLVLIPTGYIIGHYLPASLSGRNRASLRAWTRYQGEQDGHQAA